MRRKFAFICLTVLVLAGGGLAAYLLTRTVPAAVPAPPPRPRAMIDCRNFPEAASCAAGVADLAGEILGKAAYCNQPDVLLGKLRDALQVALPVISTPVEPYLESTWLARDAERRALNRARYRVLPTDCAVVQTEFLELMRELGVRMLPVVDP